MTLASMTKQYGRIRSALWSATECEENEPVRTDSQSKRAAEESDPLLEEIGATKCFVHKHKFDSELVPSRRPLVSLSLRNETVGIEFDDAGPSILPQVVADFVSDLDTWNNLIKNAKAVDNQTQYLQNIQGHLETLTNLTDYLDNNHQEWAQRIL